ncbi:MAG: hypothetical protein FD122_1975 [Stygiobacter sp.]|nr:MAG: hypothetical protein FD122_1975 [Stygiobacter sp.]KAF0212785.1 MAG: hypothetical protein FD178_3104 [Ignavibacteria bacterium]
MKGQFINTAFLNTVGLLQIYLLRVLGDEYLGCFQDVFRTNSETAFTVVGLTLIIERDSTDTTKLVDLWTVNKNSLLRRQELNND